MEQWNQTTSTVPQSPQHMGVQMAQQPKDEVSFMRQVTDNVRFAMCEAISVRPILWDATSREKCAPGTRKGHFLEVANELQQQFRLSPPITTEEVEKHWKNLKDTYVKCRKKLTYDLEGCLIRPKWKFFDSLLFLDNSVNAQDFVIRKRMHPGPYTSSPPPTIQQYEMYPGIPPQKKEKPEDTPNDEFMEFCRSLYLPLKEVGYKDRIHWLKIQKAIRDIVYDAQMESVTKNSQDIMP